MVEHIRRVDFGALDRSVRAVVLGISHFTVLAMSLPGYKPKTKPAMWRSVHPEPEPVKTFTRIPPISKRSLGERQKYSMEATEFIAQSRAQGQDVSEVHHFYGRVGRLLRAKWGWIAVNRDKHNAIHAHPEDARRLGLLCQPGLWNNYEAALKDAIRRGWANEKGERIV